MALKFGLNVKSKPGPAPPARAPTKRPTIFDDDFEDEEPTIKEQSIDLGEEISVFDGSTPPKPSHATSRTTKPPPKSKPGIPSQPPTLKNKVQQTVYSDLSADRASQKVASNATDLDSAIYDYDSFHDAQSSISAARKALEKQDAIERKPKYIANLKESALRRKQDQDVAREKLLQKEREAEGDEFADKEKFVTQAYKDKQAENKLIEEAERAKAEAEERRRKGLGGGMQSFYRGVMDDNERRHREAMEAAKMLESGEMTTVEAEKKKSDAELAAEMKARGVNIQINDEGQITDKRQLLSAGLNVAPSGQGAGKDSAEHLRTKARPAQRQDHGRKNDQREMRERQTRMMEEQLAASAKRAADEEAEELQQRELAAKSRKTDSDISSAKERYLARKREAEAAKKNAG